MAGFSTYPNSAGTDPLVPADGELNITGDVVITGSLNGVTELGVDDIQVGSQINTPQVENLSGTLVLAGDGQVTLDAPLTLVGDNLETNGRAKIGTGLGVGLITTVKSADYVATDADFLIPVDANAAGGNVTITLPAANAYGSNNGQILTVKATATHATRDIIIQRAGADTLEAITAADTAITLSPETELVHASFVSDGSSKWYLIASRGTIT